MPTPQIKLLNARIRVLEESLRVAKQNATHWFGAYQQLSKGIDPTTPGLPLALPEIILSELTREATIRTLKPDVLARKIIEQVVADRLFAAVLDQ